MAWRELRFTSQTPMQSSNSNTVVLPVIIWLRLQISPQSLTSREWRWLNLEWKHQANKYTRMLRRGIKEQKVLWGLRAFSYHQCHPLPIQSTYERQNMLCTKSEACLIQNTVALQNAFCKPGSGDISLQKNWPVTSKSPATSHYKRIVQDRMGQVILCAPVHR